MNAIIKETLKKDQITELFEQESFFMYSYDVIPEYRVIELFGADLAEWLDQCCVHEGYMKPGTDWNTTGQFSGDPRYYTLSGFKKIASRHNGKVMRSLHSKSEAGKIVDQVWEKRCERLRIEEEAEERKREERRKKRAAAKAKKDQQ